MTDLAVSLLLSLYEFLWWLLVQLARVLAALSGSPKMKQFFSERDVRKVDIQLEMAEARWRQLKKNQPQAQVWWVHVASAGELEQCLPVARVLHERHGVHFILTWMSPSALPFVRNFPGTLAVLPFLYDRCKWHKRILDVFSVSTVCFVRYDVWPGLVWQARKSQARMVMLSATGATARSGFWGRISLRLRALLLRPFSWIFTVGPQDTQWFEALKKQASMPWKVVESGDGKWWRARERAESVQRLGHSPSLLGLLEHVQSVRQNRLVVVSGSPHAEEDALPWGVAQAVGENPQGAQSRPWWIVVPHDVREGGAWARSARERGLDVSLWSECQGQGLPYGRDALVIDTIGLLAELYRLGDVAIVGGGFDGQVHNTLEPAAHGTPVLVGAHLRRAPEAGVLVAGGAALSFAAPGDLCHFVTQLALCSLRERESRLLPLQKASRGIFVQVPNTSEVVSLSLFPAKEEGA